jgi:hypothetical protein
MKNCSSNCGGRLDCMNKVLKTRTSEIVFPSYFEILKGTNTRPSTAFYFSVAVITFLT